MFGVSCESFLKAGALGTHLQGHSREVFCEQVGYERAEDRKCESLGQYKYRAAMRYVATHLDNEWRPLQAKPRTEAGRAITKAQIEDNCKRGPLGSLADPVQPNGRDGTCGSYLKKGVKRKPPGPEISYTGDQLWL